MCCCTVPNEQSRWFAKCGVHIIVLYHCTKVAGRNGQTEAIDRGGVSGQNRYAMQGCGIPV